MYPNTEKNDQNFTGSQRLEKCCFELFYENRLVSTTELWPHLVSFCLSNHSSPIVEWPSPQPIRHKICRIPLSTVIMTVVWKNQRRPAVRVLRGLVSGPSPYLKTTTSAPPLTAASERWNIPRMVRRGGVSPSLYYYHSMLFFFKTHPIWTPSLLNFLHD